MTDRKSAVVLLWISPANMLGNSRFGGGGVMNLLSQSGVNLSVLRQVTTTLLLDRRIMGNRSKPQKPRRNSAHLVFPKEGPVRLVVEEMPRDKADLEFRVAQQFVGSLRRLNITLDALRPGAEPADLECDAPDGQVIGVQIVEVVDEPLRQLRAMRTTYRDALWHVLGADLLHFNGCLVSLLDSPESPLLPKVNSGAGQVCLQHLAEFLRSLAKDVHTIQAGKRRNRSITTPNSERKIWVSVERRLPPGDPVRFELHWEGSGPFSPTGDSRSLLTTAVRLKVSKCYAKPTTAKFLLLAYSVDTFLRGEDDPEVIEASQFLDTTKHPFDEVWYLRPTAQQEFGQLIKVWPG